MIRIREPAVAGLFYTDQPSQLRRYIEALLHADPSGPGRPKALIVPHAGYRYCAAIAANAYRLLKHCRGTITRVVLVGPAHRLAFAGLAASAMDFFSTPLGRVKLDRAALESLLPLASVHINEEAHCQEHSLEVQLPFLQTLLGEDFSLIPLLVGEASAESVAELLEHLWGGPETLLLISSDLSHYYDYRSARELDLATSRAIERLDPEGIGCHQACGRIPINGLLVAAGHHQLHATTLDLRNSGDTAGGRDRVVGYGAYAFV